VTDGAVQDRDLGGMYISPNFLIAVLVIALVLWEVQRRFRARRVALTLGVLVLAALGLWLLPPLATPGDRSVGWELSHGYGGTAFDPAAAEGMTEVPIVVDWPRCQRGDWLAPPAIVYTPWSVTITMAGREPLFPGVKPGQLPQVGLCLSGMYVQVHLSEPLGGRQLFDGSRFPAHPRSADDYSWSVSQ
jgi:hypothetical protein